MLTLLRELFLALIGQPSRAGASAREAETNRRQAELQRESGPASALDAARQVGQEAVNAALWQPSPPPPSKKPRD